MSQPVPEVDRRPSIIAVPAHIASVIFGGGCRVAHSPINGAVDCAECYPHAQGHIYPPAPEPSEQPSQASASDAAASSPDAAAPTVEAPFPKSKKAITPDDAAPSA